MKKRDLTAVVMLGNYWQWSGGFAQYLEWAGQGPIPYPKVTFFDSKWFETKVSYLSWLRFFNYLKHFYKNTTAQEYYRDFLKTVITRKNLITGENYADDSTIMAWELANEPIGYGAKKFYDKWIGETAIYIKSLDKNHLVTTGSVGDGFPFSGINHLKNHSHPDIDYATVHIWVQNRGWYNPMKPEKTFQKSVQKMRKILDDHRALAIKLKKPLVLEEFGISRDLNKYAPGTETKIRDQYYGEVFGQVLQSQSSDSPIAGVNFWAWGGEASPQHKIWQAGDPFTGDPPHEAQGWYSVYASDASTIELVTKLSESLKR
jgi:mannan endo-1,4-beta-mannosidase